MGTAVCVAGALRRYGRTASKPVRADLEPLVAVSRAFALLILVSLLVALAYGTAQKAWLRDVAPYLLFVAAPLIAYDARTAWSERALRRLLMFAGIAATAAFAAQWLSNGNIVTISHVFALPSLLLGAALFIYAMAILLEGDRQRLRWLLLACGILAGLVATGTRSSLLLLVVPIATILGPAATSRGARFGLRS
jgi:hypothetical protein